MIAITLTRPEIGYTNGMTKTITYSLKCDYSNSDRYYSDIKSLTDKWIMQVNDSLTDLVNIFKLDCLRCGRSIRSMNLSAFDLLALGVMLREHGATADQLPKWWLYISTKLVDIQGRKPYFQSLIKVARSLLNGLAYRKISHSKSRRDLRNFEEWLVAMGENTKAERFFEWILCFQRIGQVDYLIDRCLELADDFSVESSETLGKYTEHVDEFSAKEAMRHPWRYDTYLRKSTRLDHHLGMLGTEIMNREFRQHFLSCPKKVVLLPPCMRYRPESECKAVATKWGQQCASCTPSCRIHQVTKLGEKRGFSVFMIPEELRVFRGEGNGKEGLGVVGVSCVLTNWAGGWDAESIDLPAQGLLLDYVGCKYHWDTEGFPTDINVRKLEELLSSI